MRGADVVLAGGAGLGAGVGEGVDLAVGADVGGEVDLAVGAGVGDGVRRMVGLGVGRGTGLEVGRGVGAGVSEGSQLSSAGAGGPWPGLHCHQYWLTNSQFRPGQHRVFPQ